MRVLIPARVTWRDDSLPHQIRLTFRAAKDGHCQQICVDCSCGAQIAAQDRWDDPDEPLRIWRKHQEEM